MGKKILWGMGILILFDQITKMMVRHFLAQGTSIAIIPNFFHLTHTTNTGIGFGLLQGMTSFAIVATVVILLWLWKYFITLPRKTVTTTTTFILLFGGSIGNLIDRIFWGFVTDFFDFRIWPVFNIADSAVTIGGILLLLMMWKEK